MHARFHYEFKFLTTYTLYVYVIKGCASNHSAVVSFLEYFFHQSRRRGVRVTILINVAITFAMEVNVLSFLGPLV